MAIASCSNGILIQLTNAMEEALVEEVRGRGRRETLYGMKKFFIAKDEITAYRPPPPGSNHAQRLLTKKNSLVQKLQCPHVLKIDRAIQRYIERHDIGWQEELNLRTVTTDIRLFGQAERRQVRLQRRGWVACRFDVVKDVRRILDEIPSNIPQNLDLGSKIEAGLSSLSWRMADGVHMPEGVSLGRGFDLPTHGYRFFLSVEEPQETARSRPSSCGLLCGIVVEHGGHRHLVRVCRIGGIIEILDQTGSKKMVAVTVAHGLCDYVLAATSRKMNGHNRRFRKKVTEIPRKSDTVAEGVPEGVLSDKKLTPITGFHAINWLGNVWSPTPQHPSSVSFGNLANVTADADFSLLDIPFNLENSFSADNEVQRITGLVMDNELYSMTEMNQELNVVIEPDRVLSATLLRDTPVIFVRGRQFAMSMIRLKNNESLPRGTSGCWVTMGNKLCGMIVAGNDMDSLAYMVSAQKLFSDIEKTVGQWPEIGKVDPALEPLQAEISVAVSEGVDIARDNAHDRPSLFLREAVSGSLPQSSSPVGGSSVTHQSHASFEDQMINSMIVSAGESNDRRFLPQNALESLINESSVSNYVERSVNLKQHALSVLVDYVLRSARKLFAILVLIEGCEILEDMYTEGLNDDDLPLVTVGERFYRRGIYISSEWASDPRLNSFNGLSRRKIASFDTEQWALLSPRFTLDENGNSLFYRLHRKVVLPWLTADRVAETGGSTIRRVKIHPAHFDFSQVSGAKEFAVKQLRSLTEETFHMEITALMKLPRHTHLNTVLTSYQWQDSHFLVFPWANGNLMDLWLTEMPRPAITTALVLWFLEQCAGLAEGLSIIHGTSKLSEEIYGRHGDIKPQNILWYRDEYSEEIGQGRMGILKISDFGETRFHYNTTKRREATTRAGVTISYSAPELDPEDDRPVSRSFDVWSLGCVYLEFATWLLRGAEGVENFRAARLKESRVAESKLGLRMDTFYQMVSRDRFFLKKISGHKKLKAVVKPSVSECVRSLQNGFISHPQVYSTLNAFLHLIMDKMLVIGEDRADAVEVLSTLQVLREKGGRPISPILGPEIRYQPVQEPSSGSNMRSKDPGDSSRYVSNILSQESLQTRPQEAASFDREREAVSQSAKLREKASSLASAAAVQVFPLGKIEEEIEEIVRETNPAGWVRETWHRKSRRVVGSRYTALHQEAKASNPSASKTVDPDASNFTSMSGPQLLKAERALLGQLMAIKEVQIQRER